jgi:hypothetical protein
MSITLTERVPVAADDSNAHILKVEILLPGVTVNVECGVTETDPREVRISWEDLEDIDAVANKFLFSTLVMFKTLVPMLIKAKTLRAMV